MAGKFPAACGVPLSMVSGIPIPRPLGRGSLFEHACAAGAAGSHAGAEALSRSRGGFGCKIHALTDALGLSVRFILTGGQEAADITQATPLMQDISTGALLADKGYDANALLDWLGQRDIAAVTQSQPQSAKRL